MVRRESAARKVVVRCLAAFTTAVTGCEEQHSGPPYECEEAPVAPTDVIGRVVALTAGTNNTCAVFEDGVMRCWGDNGWGQLGDGTLVGGRRARQTLGLPPVRQVAVATEHICALTTGQCVFCWGGGWEGQLGTGELSSSRSPLLVESLGGTLYIAAYARMNLALNLNQVSWWGQDDEGIGRVPAVLWDWTPYRAADLGDGFGCGLRHDGRVECWGDNTYGQLGTGDATDHAEPVEIEALSEVTQLAVGTLFACAVRAGGTLWCWGHNEFGQVGDGTTTNRATPQLIALANVAEVSIYSAHACARPNDGTIWCWGDNRLNEVGNGAVEDVVSTPWKIASISGARAVAAARASSCALQGDHDVWCWGYNKNGELGDDTYENSATPVKVVWGP